MLEPGVVSEGDQTGNQSLSTALKDRVESPENIWVEIAEKFVHEKTLQCNSFTAAALDGFCFTLGLLLLYLWVLPEVSGNFVPIHQGQDEALCVRMMQINCLMTMNRAIPELSNKSHGRL